MVFNREEIRKLKKYLPKTYRLSYFSRAGQYAIFLLELEMKPVLELDQSPCRSEILDIHKKGQMIQNRHCFPPFESCRVLSLEIFFFIELDLKAMFECNFKLYVLYTIYFIKHVYSFFLISQSLKNIYDV